jgi:hypothetical protein
VRTCTGHGYTGLATYECNDGFWSSGAPPVCLPMACPPLNPPTAGAIGTCGGTFNWADPTTCAFTCSSNYLLTGGPMVCGLDMNDSAPSWSAFQICIPGRCTNLAAPANGTMGTCTDTLSWQDNASCSFACNADYVLSGSPITCSMGDGGAPIWSTLQTCVPMACVDLAAPSGGSLGSCVTPATWEAPACNFACNLGYTLSGAPIMCLYEGSGTPEWSTLQTCVAETCTSALIPPADGSIGNCQQNSAWGSPACSFACNDGYEVQGAPIVCSLDGEGVASWSAPQTCLDAMCLYVDPPGYGDAGYLLNCTNGTMYDSGSVCAAACPSSCFAGPPFLMLCLSTVWTVIQNAGCETVCCGPLSSGGSGTNVYYSDCVTSSGIPSGGECTLSCGTFGYPGSISYACNVSTWTSTPTPPACEPVTCRGLHAPADGTLGSCVDLSPWTAPSCNFTCNDGFTLYGDPIACVLQGDDSGEWGPAQVCLSNTVCDAACFAASDPYPCTSVCDQCSMSTTGTGFTDSSTTVTSHACISETFCNTTIPASTADVCEDYCNIAFSGALSWDTMAAVCDPDAGTLSCGCSMG